MNLLGKLGLLIRNVIALTPAPQELQKVSREPQICAAIQTKPTDIEGEYLEAEVAAPGEAPLVIGEQPASEIRSRQFKHPGADISVGISLLPTREVKPREDVIIRQLRHTIVR